jgi:hypothetical protein
MAPINANYTRPVVVDGYPCWNCHQVAEAKKGLNPATQGPGSLDGQAAAQVGASAPGSPTTQPNGTTAAAPATVNGVSRTSSARLDILV